MKGTRFVGFMPTSQPVRISLAQRLTGQVANGDLARANFAGITTQDSSLGTIGGEDYHVLEADHDRPDGDPISGSSIGSTQKTFHPSRPSSIPFRIG